MQPITGVQCGDLLAMWLQKSSSPEVAKQVAKEIGYNDSPLFGAKSKKIKLMAELATINTALAIFAVNQAFDTANSKSIIDPFLSVSRKSIFAILEKHDSNFKQIYQARMAEYFGILSKDKPTLDLSFSFLTHLGIDPLKCMQGQILLAARFGDSLSTTLDVLKRITLQSPGRPANAPQAREELKKIHAALRENADALSTEVEQRAKALSDALIRDKDEMTRGLVHTVHGSKVLGDQMVKQLNLHIYERCLFLMLGLVGMRRSGGKELYITGIEFKALQEAVSKKVMAAAAQSRRVAPLPLEFNPEAFTRSVLTDLLEVRKTITAYCIAVKSRNPEPESVLLKWFELKSGFKLEENPHVARALQSDA